jgi:hypothetical protein
VFEDLLDPAAIVARYAFLMRVNMTNETAIHVDEVTSCYGSAPGILAHKDGSRLAIVLNLIDGGPSWATFPMSRRGLR